MAHELLDKNENPILYPGREETIYASYFRKGVSVEKKVDMKSRILTIVGTDETKDREGDIIRMKGWELKDYLLNPVFMWVHDYNSVPIAAALKLIKKRNPIRMVFNVRFPPEGIYEFADLILNLYNLKQINASSVGFIPKKWNKMDRDPDDESWGEPREFIKQELLELSGCPVPCNPAALQEAFGGVKGLMKIIDQDPKDLSKYLLGETSIPEPERKEEILGEIKEVDVEVIDETLPVQIVNPEGVEEVFETVASKESEEEKQSSVKRRRKKAKEVEEKEEKEEYNCECLACGFKLNSDEHCNKLECPECGGTMRRAERPGPGQEGIEGVEELTGGVLVYKTPEAVDRESVLLIQSMVKEAYGEGVKLLIAEKGSEIFWLDGETIEHVVDKLKEEFSPGKPKGEKAPDVYDTILTSKNSSGQEDQGADSEIGPGPGSQESSQNPASIEDVEKFMEEMKKLKEAIRRLNK